jgi:urease accessory protein
MPVACRMHTEIATSIRLWQLISPSLPVGGYAYSQGLESVIGDGGLRDEHGVREWVRDLVHYGLAHTDLPILLRAQRATQRDEPDELARWCRLLVARRETAELRLADLAMGRALCRLLADLGVAVFVREAPLAAAFGMAAAAWRLPEQQACAGYAWAACESQVAAAVKLVPLGHTAGQRILLEMGPAIHAAVVAATHVADEDIGLGMPGLAIASARHETQYSRLFRS